MAEKSKFFRVAVEGATTDGRTIDAAWLTQMAATYNPATYAARVNMEHIRGITADKPFKALGDVTALKTETVSVEIGGKTEQKLALFAQIDPTDDLVAINRDRQKLYTSMEVNPDFAKSGKAYLMGLAVTDSPASLGTEMLQFAAGQGDKNPLAARKLDKANLFTAAAETTIEFEAPAAETGSGALAELKAFISGLVAGKPKDEPKTAVTPPAPANDNFAALFATGLEKISGSIEKVASDLRGELGTLRSELGTVKTEFGSLKADVENTDGFSQRRQPATGGGGTAIATDC